MYTKLGSVFEAWRAGPAVYTAIQLGDNCELLCLRKDPTSPKQLFFESSGSTYCTITANDHLYRVTFGDQKLVPGWLAEVTHYGTYHPTTGYDDPVTTEIMTTVPIGDAESYWRDLSNMLNILADRIMAHANSL